MKVGPRVRHILAGLLLLSLSLLPAAAYMGAPMPHVWAGSFGPSTCVGTLCLIVPGKSGGFWELSLGEYSPPTP